MPPYVFDGFPSYLESAGEELGKPESIAGARRIVALTALANLCAQAAHGDRAHVEGILAKAGEFRDQLAVAHRAADMMLADVDAGRNDPSSESPAGAKFPVVPTMPSDHRGVRKDPRTLRDRS